MKRINHLMDNKPSDGNTGNEDSDNSGTGNENIPDEEVELYYLKQSNGIFNF